MKAIIVNTIILIIINGLTFVWNPTYDTHQLITEMIINTVVYLSGLLSMILFTDMLPRRYRWITGCTWILCTTVGVYFI